MSGTSSPSPNGSVTKLAEAIHEILHEERRFTVAHRAGIEAGFDRMETKFNRLDERFKDVENRLDGMDDRLKGVENHLAQVEIKLNR